jgi:clan AA aspartic protease (TIGR02281 family)
LPQASRVAGHRAHGGVLLVPVCVNGQSFELLVDTGSAFTGLSAATAAYLRMVPQAGAGRRIAPAHGSPVRVLGVTVDEIRVGGCAVQGVAVIVLDLCEELKIDGLLGMDFLGQFRVTIESDTATLILRPTRAGP